MRLAPLSPAAATTVLLSSVLGLQASGVETATAVSQPSVDALLGNVGGMPPSTTRRVVLTGTNFNANGTKLYFDPPASRVTYRVLSSTRIALFVKNRNTRSTVAKNEPLRIVAIDTGAGAVQINPGDEGLFIGSISAGAEDGHKQANSDQVDTTVGPPPIVRPSSEAISRSPRIWLWVHGANFNMEYTELYFDPPLPEELIERYEVSRPDLVTIVLKHTDLDPGPLKVVAIDTGSGVVHLNPEGGGTVVGMVLSTLSGSDITVKEDESVHIYQSTKQFQITGSGFKDNTQVLFMNGLCGGEIRSTIHTKVGEQPDELTLELAEGFTWYNQHPAYPPRPLKLKSADAGKGRVFLPPPLELKIVDAGKGWAFLPQPLELKSVDAGKGWTQLGPTDSPGKPLTVAIVFEDPSIYASDTEIFHGYTTDLDVKGTSFRHGGTIKRGDWVYDTVPPILIFDPPIDPEVVEVVVNGYGQVTVSFQQRDDPQWAPAGYFGPLKITAMDTGAGMVVLDPPVTVANVVPGSPYEFFLLKRINQLLEDGAIKHHQERVNQVAREWQAMTPAEKAQAAGALVPTLSVEASPAEIYARAIYHFVVDGANFLPRSKLMFDPPLHEDNFFWENFVSSTRIEISCMAMGCFVAEPGQLKVVAIDTGAGLVRLNPEDGGVVVATVKPHITVQQDENLLIYQSTKQIRIGGSGFEEDMEVRFQRALHAEEAKFTMTDTKPDELTLSLAEGDAWIKDTSSLPMALLVSSVKASSGKVNLEQNSWLHGRKVATVFEDPSIQARDTEIYRSFTRELYVYGTGFNNVVQPILVFAPPLDDTAVNVQVVSRTMIRLTLSATQADWTATKDYLGPLKIEGIDTGAGMIFFDSPVTVAVVSPSIGTQYGNVAQVAANIDAFPSVEPSSGELFEGVVNNGIVLTGTNLGLRPKLYFDPALPEDTMQQFISSTEIAITRNFTFGIPPDTSPWRPEPGPLKIVAIDNGAGRVPLNPDDGGVVVATVLANVMIQPNKDLHIYQSTKQIQITGSGFYNDIQVNYLGGDAQGAGDVFVDTLSDSQMTITLTEDSVWVKNLNVLPVALWMGGDIEVAGFKSQTSFLGGGSSLSFRGPIATVFEEPSIDASDIEINHTGSQELVIWGTGFNNVVAPVMDFDPPLDFASLHVNVVNRTTIQLTLDTAQAGWVPVEQLGPLKIKGVDTGAGMVVFASPVTVATVVPDSEPFFNQGFHVDLDAVELDSRKSATPSLHDEENAAEPETEEFGEKVDDTVVPPPSVEASSTVIYMGSTDSLAVKGDNFDMATRLIFNPPLGTGFEMRVFSRTEIDIFTKTVIDRPPSTWRAEPGPLKVVAIDTGAGLVQLNPKDGGVVVAMVQ